MLKLMGATYAGEMLPSLLAKQLAPCLGTIQTQPHQHRRDVAGRGAELRRRGAAHHPGAGAQGDADEPGRAARQPAGAARSDAGAALRPLQATTRRPAQKAYIDSLVTSQTQVRNINQSLLAALGSIKDNSANSQILAAVTLIQMKVTPVIAIHIPFGGDNHRDVGLAAETTQTVSGVATIARSCRSSRPRGSPTGDVRVAQRLRAHARPGQHRRAPAQPEPPGVDHDRQAVRGRRHRRRRPRRRRLRRAGDRLDERRRRGRRRRRARRLAGVVRRPCSRPSASTARPSARRSRRAR